MKRNTFGPVRTLVATALLALAMVWLGILFAPRAASAADEPPPQPLPGQTITNYQKLHDEMQRQDAALQKRNRAVEQSQSEMGWQRHQVVRPSDNPLRRHSVGTQRLRDQLLGLDQKP